ncbi:MAG TPA: inorganic diphosphatase [Flavipsychrobacter sp.]|nr:inorganic diphosphatase [Flavipsychrobacter sp.]
MNFRNISPTEDGLLNVIIETVRGSQNKFNYDPEMSVFKLKKTLPMGTVFPFDFGFVPNTRAEDGDPLDVLVIMEQTAFAGCLVQCRPIGVLQAKQKGRNKKEIRNDRIVAVSHSSKLYAEIKDVKDLNKHMSEEIANFFIDYNKHEDKTFTPIRWLGKKEALKMVAESSQAF